MRTRTLPLAVAAVLTIALAALRAAPLRAAISLGAELQVNTYTPGQQRNSVVVSDTDGDFVVVWVSAFQDGSSYGLFAQRFASSGAKLGGEFQVNTYTSTFQQYVSAAMDADGDFVVAWTSHTQDGSDRGVFARRFASSGAPAGGEFQVNLTTGGAQSHPALAMAQNGGFVVAWQANAQDGYGYGLFARRFSSAGAGLGGEFQINTYTAKAETLPVAAASASGDFVVVWEGNAHDGAGAGIFLQRFASAGSRVGAELRVNAYTSGDQVRPAVAMDPAGDFVVTWTSVGQDGSETGAFGRRFASSGTPGPEQRINVRTVESQREPKVAIDANGRFVVVWMTEGQDGYGYAVFGRRFSRTAAAIGGEFQVNSATALHEIDPAAAMEATGDFVVTWTTSRQSGFDPGETEIFLHRFAIPLLDVDGDGAAEPLIDGVLIMRRMFGFTGPALVGNAVDLVDCTRCTSGEIEAYIAALGLQLDTDGDGALQPLTDGLLILRHLFGFTGTALAGGAVATGHCTRCTGAAITAYLSALGP